MVARTLQVSEAGRRSLLREDLPHGICNETSYSWGWPGLGFGNEIIVFGVHTATPRDLPQSDLRYPLPHRVNEAFLAFLSQGRGSISVA